MAAKQVAPAGVAKELQTLIDAAKKISTDVRPRDEHRGAGEPRFVAKPYLEPEPVVEASRALVVVPQGEPVAKPTLLEGMNTKHHVIGNYGGKCVVFSWERWDVNRDVFVPEFQTFDDIVKVYLNLTVTTDRGLKSYGDWWLHHPQRKQYSRVVYEPGQGRELEGNLLNLWRGFAVKPEAGDWSLMQEHIVEVLADGDPESAEYILNWLAWTVQNPGKVAEAAIVFQGGEGAGKGTLSNAMTKIFGPHALPISNPDLLIGGFSGHLHACSFLALEEAFWAGNHKAEGVLKNIISDSMIAIHPKFGKPFMARNCLHIMMTSNADWIVPVSHDARRYAVFRVSDRRRDDADYFDALNAQLDGGGLAAMLHDLLERPLGKWHPKMICETAALTDQKLESLRGLDLWIEGLLQDGVLPGVPKFGEELPENRALSEELLRSAQVHDRFTNGSRIVKKLRALDMLEDGFNVGGQRGWIFRPLDECRRNWERRNRGVWQWHLALDEWAERPAKSVDMN
jgi:hypothetical protein